MARYGKRKFKVGMRSMSGTNTLRFIFKLVLAIFSMFIGGKFLAETATAMTGETSYLWSGLSIIGWNVTSGTMNGVTGGGILGAIGLLILFSALKDIFYIKM